VFTAFIFGVFGIGSKEKEIKDIQNIVCKKCGSMSTYKLSKVYKYFHIFFIPVFKWGSKYYLKTRCCRSYFELKREIGERIENEEIIDISNEDIIEIYNEDNNFNNSFDIQICEYCGKNINRGYVYCPHCGHKHK
jgi:hypothetical protein